MTLSLAAVFIPVLFMGGVLGRLFREFSVTICVAILISGVVSVTLTPMLCSRFLKKPAKHGDETSTFGRVTEAGFDGCCSGYDRTLQIVLAPPRRDDGRRSWRVLVAHRRRSSSSCRRASFPSRTPIRLR